MKGWLRTWFSASSVAVVVALGARSAQATMCRWLDGTHAQMAADLLKNAREVRLFCASCGDRRPLALRLAKVEADRADKTGERLRLTDASGKVHVAATDTVYIPHGPPDDRTFLNVGDMATCAPVSWPWPRKIGASAPLPFDDRAAHAVLTQRSVRECDTTRGQDVQITVTFAPTGLVTRVDVPAFFAGTPIAACIDARLRPAQISAFSEVVDRAVTQSFVLGQDPH